MSFNYIYSIQIFCSVILYFPFLGNIWYFRFFCCSFILSGWLSEKSYYQKSKKRISN
jgi:hypothetical protein